VDHRYRIEQKLAVGGFGTIYRATDTLIGRQVALKILHRELAGDQNVVARFRRETAALAKLRSTNTLTMYDVGETDDTLYFVMELLRGESLHDVFTKGGPLPWRRMAHIARGVCASLREAHGFGIVHRDLKPANIFLERHALDVDCVKVLDFGIAKVLASSELENRDLTRVGQMIGTFDYMAPEQMVGAPCTNKSDMFTLGVVLHEMISGTRPYSAANPAEMLMVLMTTTPRPLTGVPSELARIVKKCLSREAQDRPDVVELDRVLETLLAVDENAFSDADEPTLITPHAPRPPAHVARTTMQRGSVSTSSPWSTAVAGQTESASVAARSRESMPSVMLAAGFAPTLDVRPAQMPTVIARGSDVAIAPLPEAPVEEIVRDSIARDIELALAETVATTPITDAQAARVPSVTRAPRDNNHVAVRFVPTPSAPVAPPRARLASGTESPDSDDNVKTNLALPQRAVTLPNAPESASITFVRFATISVCLFGLGFLAALALWSA